MWNEGSVAATDVRRNQNCNPIVAGRPVSAVFMGLSLPAPGRTQ
jgi:hypothetical protein